MFYEVYEALQIEDPEERRRRLTEIYENCIESERELMKLAKEMNDTETASTAKSRIDEWKAKIREL